MVLRDCIVKFSLFCCISYTDLCHFWWIKIIISKVQVAEPITTWRELHGCGPYGFPGQTVCRLFRRFQLIVSTHTHTHTTQHNGCWLQTNPLLTKCFLQRQTKIFTHHKWQKCDPHKNHNELRQRMYFVYLIVYRVFAMSHWRFGLFQPTCSVYYAALLPRRGPHIASHSVCPSVCLSVRPVIVTERHVAPPSELKWHMYFSARAEGRISYSHLGRTSLFKFKTR